MLVEANSQLWQINKNTIPTVKLAQQMDMHSINLTAGMKEYVGNDRPQKFQVGIVNHPAIGAFVLPSPDSSSYFFGIYLGAFLQLHNVLLEALQYESGLLRYFINGAYKSINLNTEIGIAQTVSSVEDMIHNFEVNERTGCDPYYRYLADDMVAHAIEFLITHELAHALRDHHSFTTNYLNGYSLGLIDEQVALQAFSNDRDSEVDQLLRGIEADADMQAIFMGYRLFEKSISRDDPAFIDHFLDDAVFRFFSIGALFLLMDDNLPFPAQMSSHPPSYFRLMYIQSYIVDYYHLEYDFPKERLIDELVTALLEVENLAILLGAKRGRWIRADLPDNNGHYLEIASLLNDRIFLDEDSNVTEVSDHIDKVAIACFVDGAAEQ